ncbi:hypothetical protein P9112_012526 [Eukaryota sp. TZLM1-RC]
MQGHLFRRMINTELLLHCHRSLPSSSFVAPWTSYESVWLSSLSSIPDVPHLVLKLQKSLLPACFHPQFQNFSKHCYTFFKRVKFPLLFSNLNTKAENKALEELMRLRHEPNDARNSDGRRSGSRKVATVAQPNFKINAFSSHTCFGSMSTTNKAANAEYIANMANFINKKCSCNGWQNDGYPCTPSLAVYLKKQVVPFDGIAKIHSLEYYKKSFETSIHIVPDRSEWEFKSKFQMVDPPSVPKVGGRPRKKRIDAFSPQRKRQSVALVQDDWLSLFQEDNVPELIDVDDVYPD